MPLKQTPHVFELRVLQDEGAHVLSQSRSSLPAELLRQRRVSLRGSLPQEDARNQRQ